MKTRSTQNFGLILLFPILLIFSFPIIGSSSNASVKNDFKLSYSAERINPLIQIAYSNINCLVCDNVTNGGEISGDETGCGSPLWDPGVISNVTFPSGGSGVIEYMWMFTTDDPNKPIVQWSPIPNTNSPTFDPGPISETTYYTRCSRRAGCSIFTGESNYVTKKFECCDNVTNPGTIVSNQTSCNLPYDPTQLTSSINPSGGSGSLVYVWKYSYVGGAINDTTWFSIPNSNTPNYDPPSTTQTIYYARCVKREGCSDYLTSNILKITIFTNNLNLSVTHENAKCYGGNEGSINLTIIGNSSPYTFNWDNAPDVEDPVGLVAGNYNVTVTDINGCTKTASVIITQPSPLVLTSTTLAVNCKDGKDGSINLSVAGGTTPYTFNWDNAPDVEDPFGLAAGTYNVTVTDANGCTKTTSATITEPTPINLTSTIVNVKCNGGNDGSINLSVSGGTAPYSFNWDNAPDVEDPSGLTAGTYNVTVTDANGCTKTASASITQPMLINLTSTVVNVKCNGSNDGSVNLSVSGGTAPYSFNWDNAPDVEDPSGLAAGTYNVTVTDANGCAKTASASITQPMPISLTPTVVNVKCNGGNDGSINLTLTGGTAPYTYNWDNAPDVEDPSGLATGTYNVTVTDANGCTKTASATITQPMSLTLASTVVNVKCNGGNDGSINLTVAGGTSPFTFNWDNAPDVEDPSGLAAGTYNVTVTDANGCTKTTSATITEPSPINLTSTIVNVKCNAGNDGSINLSVSGGTAPYSFNWDNAPDVEDPSGLTAGTYNVTVTDANGCTKTASATITQPTPVNLTSTVVNVKCNGGNDGSINLTVSGGTAPYSFNWDNAPDVEDPSGLAAGTYNVTVTDANGCTKTTSAIINQPNPISLTSTIVKVKCNGGNDGSINLTVTGGTAPYTFNWDNAPDVEDPSGLAAGTYNVTVTDANGCTKTASAIIEENSTINILVTSNNVKCNGGKDGSINLSVSGGTAPYSFNWDNAPDVEDPSGLTAGTYNVTVTDANGCKITSSAIITEPTLIDLTITTVNVKCNGGKDGSINLTVSGGTAPYSFNWDNAPDVEDPSGLTAGTYNVTVTDANGCTKTASASITQPMPISLTSTGVNVKCNGGNDGSINLTVSGGTAPYSFNWDNAPDVEDPSGLAAGTYNVTVTDANGCTKTASATINQPNPISLTSTVVKVKCNGGNDGSINLTVTGGTAPYTFNWDNAPDVEDPSGLAAGTYNVTVTDANGCTKTSSAIIEENSTINILVTSNNVKCNGGKDGSINLSVSGGTAPYSFNWDNAPDVEDPSGLTAGTYNVTITDANGCKITSSAIITEPTLIDLTITTINVKCNGGKDGSVNLTVSGGTAPYSFNWDNAPDVEDPSGLTAGTYNVTATDANGCTKTASATITQPTPVNLTSTVVNVKCNGGNDGSINLTVSGGTAPYSFNWDNAPDVEDPSGLAAGTYNVTVTDANGCTKTTSATINQPNPISLTSTVVKVKCNGGNDGSINLTVTGGTAPYTFNWDNAPDVEDPSGLAEGTYNVTVTDANGCTKTASATIDENSTIDILTSATNVKCNGGKDGSINLSVSGGTAPYSFNWDNAPDVEDPSGLAAGTYNVTVTDSNGCKKTASVAITQPTPLILTSNVVNVKCNGGADGSINLSVSGGTAPYSFNWDNAPDVEDPSGLAAGTYNVTVTDANGCTKTASASITQPMPISLTSTVVNVKCNGGNDGSINLTVSGGTAPYSFNWDNAPDVEDPSGLAAGTYNVTVTDANGCTKTTSATINQPNPISLTSTVVKVKCNGGNDGSINLTVTGGTAPYTFNWDNAPDVEDPSGLAAGTYNVTVTDANGCTKTASATIDENSTIDILTSATNVKCNGGKDGSINLSVSGGTAPYFFNWDNAPDVEDPSGLAAGTYNVTVTDSNGCKKTASVAITQPTPLILTSNVVNVKCNGGADGSINLSVSGGTAPYSFNWDNAPDVEDPSGLAAGTYNVTVTDANGCTKTASATITQPMPISLTSTVVNVKCNAGNDGSINLTVAGGTAPYAFNWDNAPDVEDPSGLAAGTYIVTVTDANGCTKTASATITQPTPVNLTSTVVNVKCNGGNDGSINLTVTGGTAPYTFNWDNAPDVEDPSGLAAGTYNVTVTDANGCTKTASATIDENSTIDILTSATNVKCNGGKDGSINLSVSGGTAPYSFNWDNAPDVEDPSGLAAGTYNVTVTDSNGCKKTASVAITQPTPLILTSNVVNVKCNGGADGSINLSVSGGTAPYSFNWDNAPDVEDPSGLAAGTYNVTVTDANGCTKTASATITQPTPVNLTSTVVNVKCNGGNDGSINLTVSGGTAPYSFNWDNAPDVEDPSGLAAGTYIVTVTDANGCTKTASATITQPTPVNLTSTVVNVKCNGGNDGSINLTVAGGTSPFTFNWDKAPDVEDPSGLSVGTYNVTVTDANGCTKTTSDIITGPTEIIITSTIENVKCNGGNDGSVNLTVSGGTAPYYFNWDKTQDVEDPSGLAPGIYKVTVTDANGCTKTASASITQPMPITLTSTVGNVKCSGGNDGFINLSVAGGTAPYSFNWDNTPDVEDPSGLTAGTYNVTVTDANGCTKTTSASITQPTILSLTAIVKNVSCKGGKDGSITLSISGGTAPYTYDWDNAPDVQNPSGLMAGSFTVIVTDKNGCFTKFTFNISEPSQITISSTSIKPVCINSKTGKIFTTVSGGTSPYTFDWDNAPDVQNPEGLSNGTYKLTVTDAKGCTATHSVVINGTQNNCVNIGDYIWIDSDKDGIQDSYEKGVNGIKVSLVDVGPDMLSGTGDDKMVDMQFTNTKGLDHGYYLFENVPPGKYTVMFMPDLAVYKFTIANSGSNDLIDSDANLTTGKTEIFTVNDGDPDNLSFDAGLCLVCDNLTNGGTIGYDEILCGPGSVSSPIVNITLPSGGSGNIEYVWMYSTKDPQFSPTNPDWYAIPNSNNPSYSPGKLNETTYFVRCARREGCSVYSGESNEVTKIVLESPLVAKITNKPSGTICKKEKAFFSALDNNIPGVQYSWFFGADANPASVIGKDATTFWTTSGSKVATLTVSINGYCSTQDIAVITVGTCTSSKIKIVSFDAVSNQDKTVDLSWETSKINQDHLFNIEKSLDGVTFNSIASSPGVINYISEYKDQDKDYVKDTVYYRLKLELNTGEIEYSEIKMVDFNKANPLAIKVYPNPTNGLLYIDCNLALSEDHTILITDLLGRNLNTKIFNKLLSNETFDLSDLPSGVYRLQILNSYRSIIYNKNIVKQ